MPKAAHKDHEIRIRRMIVSGRYDKDFAERLDGLFREWGLEDTPYKLPSRRQTVQVKTKQRAST